MPQYPSRPRPLRPTGAITSPPLRRGQFVRHNVTGQVFLVKEHGRGADYMVRTAHKSDGIWVGATDVTPCKDPHPWNWTHLLRVAVAFMIAALIALGAFNTMTGHGVGFSDAFWEAALPSGLVVLVAMSSILGLNRP
jgi:hypothetical protein